MKHRPPEIPNIDIGKAYDRRYRGADIHMDSLHNLSEFFGRDMPAHRHDQYYQMHWIRSGTAKVQLGEQSYSGTAPLFFFTPPAIPHSFQLDEQAEGLVLTVRREMVNRMVSGSGEDALEKRFSTPAFYELDSVVGRHTRDAHSLQTLTELLGEEFFDKRPGRKHSLPALVNLILVNIFRISELPERSQSLRQVELEIFESFNKLVDAHYTEHWPLQQYSTALNVTHGRLADICQRLTGSSPKKLVYERQIQEAKWKLIYTTTAINAICDHLGFKDPAYFCRFFSRHTGLSPREFRRQALIGEIT
jgi:AraC family 4-hydroxyphenylacetate 3-monooxygenase operon regulatory protein